MQTCTTYVRASVCSTSRVAKIATIALETIFSYIKHCVSIAKTNQDKQKKKKKIHTRKKTNTNVLLLLLVFVLRATRTANNVKTIV